MHLHHLALRTSDVDRLAAFYRYVLGLPVVHEAAERAWLDAGGVIVMVELRADGEPSISPGSMDLVAFRVTDEERRAMAQRLRSLGIAKDGETAHTLYFRDPDGRRVGVSSYRFEPALGDAR